MKRLNQKGFGIVEGLLIFVIVALIGGTGYYVYRNSRGNLDSGVETTDVEKKPTQEPTNENEKNELADADICKVLNQGARFQSINKYEAGESQNGVSKGHWSIMFESDKTFNWFYSDVAQAGEYSCTNNTLVIKNYTYEKIQASYNKTSGVLTWDGIEYRKTEKLQ